MPRIAGATGMPAFGIECLKADPKKHCVVNKGDTVSLGTPGGGGHGDPRQRNAASLAADMAAGYVTDRSAYLGRAEQDD